MGFQEVAYLAWPWMGLGAAIVLLVLLFATDALRSRTDAGRWHDAAWLSWLAVPVYMLHVFEEYGLHVTGGQFDLVTAFEQTGVMAMFGGDFNLLAFPEINIGLVYVAFPIAAALGRKRPVVGLMPYGFMLVNGLTHVGGTLRFGGGLLSQPGNVTGLFCFIPLFVWFVYACRKDGLLDGRGTPPRWRGCPSCASSGSGWLYCSGRAQRGRRISFHRWGWWKDGFRSCWPLRSAFRLRFECLAALKNGVKNNPI